ncbi:tetratricopeptide repeat protein [Telmatospirillum siberiense]|uniref:Sulfotransferase n=1 Tax=Telmatospirillum siberiense TaxID=382514 RepID=A0A2N3PV11_9PROT|nr:tetratricopeptide repeat protein [Telmatospirillum siberiense]PKU24236.1 sulfotransferase [Telmatospirillum siberiense]
MTHAAPSRAAVEEKRPPVSFEIGLAHHRAGRLDQAEAIYRRILEADKTHADSLHLLGVVSFQEGKHDTARDLICKAVDLHPDNRIYLDNLAQVLRAMGRRDEAISRYRLALLKSPDDWRVRNQLGLLLGEIGDLDAEAEQYAAVLRQVPDNVDAHFNLANLLARRKRPDEAIGVFRRLLLLKPDFAAAHNNLATVLSELSADKESERCYRRALHLDPRFAEAHNNLGLLLGKVGRNDEAERCLRRACELKPDFAEAMNNLGNLLWMGGRPEEAEACCREALRLKPGYPSAALNLGNSLRERSRFDQAEFWYRRAVQADPDWAEANNNLSSLLLDLGRLDEAIVRYRTALSQKPDYPDAHTNLAIALLLAGRCDEGWREYEWRWKQDKNRAHVRPFRQPLWKGEATGDRVLLLHAEQGLGDTLQFCRFVPEIAARRRVILEVQPPLVPLLAGLPGVERIVASGDPLPPFDLHCPFLSIPRVLGVTLESLPATAPYLRADPQRVAFWRRRVGELDGLRVGIVWAGNQTMAADRRRSIPLEQFFPLADMDGVHFVSLQKGTAAGQLPPPGFRLHDWTGELADFADTAALAEALDLIISVDTAVVHLAGALGRPVWLLNRSDRCWRWLLNRDDSPWYPTLRQFRQPYPGDWLGVLRAVRAELQSRIRHQADVGDLANKVSLEQGMNR